MRNALSVLAALLIGGSIGLGLTGCDAAKELGTNLYKQFPDAIVPITIAMVPGYKVNVDGLTFPIYGTETCPSAVTAKVFILGGGYDYPGQGTAACVVIEPGTEKVVVRRVMDGALVVEVWRVEREGGETIRLWTADSKPVGAAKQ